MLFPKQPPQRILVVTLRFLGDTLLTTALINALKQAYPTAEIDVLLYKNTVGMMEDNYAISNCITCAPKPSLQGYHALFKRLFRRYDLAISTQTGDRPTLYSFLAASTRIGFVPHPSKKGGMKRYFFQKSLIFDKTKTHTVLELLRLCSLLNIKPAYQLTPPSTKKPFPLTEKPYVVMHVLPQWRYKQWPRENWIALAYFLEQHSLQIILSGSPDSQELQHLNAIQAKMPQNTLNIAGKVSLAQLATVIKKAQFFIGPDTGITHLAAATGVKTIALFGPSDPVKWTPWPCAYTSNTPPFKTKGCQHVNNVYLIQANLKCVPCYLEGCEQHQQSHSDCLDAITVTQVTKTVERILLTPFQAA